MPTGGEKRRKNLWNLNYFYLKEGNGKRCFSYEDVKEKLTSPLLGVLSGAKKQELAESDGAFTLAGQEKTITAFLKENTSANNALLSFVNTNNAHHLTYYLAKRRCAVSAAANAVF